MKNLSIRKFNELSKKKKKGFTLVELIIVIAIIAILAAMAIPKFSSVRIDAKVSNDVVAAKNLQTQIQTAIANGTIEEANVTSTLVPATIYGKLDGTAGTSGNAEAITGYKFYYKVDADGNVQVSVGASSGTYQLAPETDTISSTTDGVATTTAQGRSAYAIKAAE